MRAVAIPAPGGPEVPTVVDRDSRLQRRVAGEYAPEQTAEAHRRMEAGGLRGRAVSVFRAR
jgi:hypothetical protein